MSITPTEALDRSKLNQERVTKEAVDYYVDCLTEKLKVGFDGKKAFEVFETRDLTPEVREGIIKHFEDNWKVEFLTERLARKKSYRLGVNQIVIEVIPKQ